MTATVKICAISPISDDFRAIALSADESTIYMHIEQGPLGKHWYWWKRGNPGTMKPEFDRRSERYPATIAGKFEIVADA